ncbi:membrane protein [Croceibacterium mercuriale]|uniref:Membrane protein n=1 Tax=Croceibacterium mercuriale TaxID=1572751 RepID=A0A0B2C2A1_9SPHN|nr:TPM domain-containing protein [Croceibacterium mercuriale]KHL26255.1 membrane protein [Croceibacterium mercuriale]
MAYLTPDEHARVSAAVAAAEAQTSGEIVTIVADLSDGYMDVALAWAALGAFAVLALLPFMATPVLDALAVFHGGWNVAWAAPGIFAAAAAIGIGVFLLLLAAQAWLPLRIAMVPGFIRTDRAEDRAIALFKVGAERRTTGRTGVLIYLSMREHRAEIVADDAINALVPDDTWGEAMAALLQPLKDGRIADGMIAAIEQVGAVLAQHFPRAADDRNELPDRLIEL